MYNLSPTIRSHWDALFDWLGRESGIPLAIITHAAPAPLSELWERPDVGAVFMCGYPFAMMAPEHRPQPLAAPVSAADWSGGRPVYASRIVVARSSSLSLDDLSSARWGWTVRDSQSGYNAPREFLATLKRAGRLPEATGPFINPAGMIEAVAGGKVDVGAIDAYACQLLDLHEPKVLAGLRVIATTSPAPFPLLVSARQQPKETVDALRTVLWHAQETSEGRQILAALGLSGFIEPDITAYETLPGRAMKTDEIVAKRW
jgi:ABC-type phosphate/phosphonate transport system substrate-binding protein